MNDRTALPGLPAELAVRWVALGALEEAAAAHTRLADPTETEALHDFRVGLRRLRSTLRAYRDLLGDSVRGRDRRALRAIAHATGEARDAEVQIAWLEKRLKRARGPERAGLDEALERARARAAAAAGGVTTAAAGFPAERQRLERRLRPYATAVRPQEPPGGILFRVALAQRLRTEAAALEGRLAQLMEEGQQDEAHLARIDAKRIRYLLEPVRDVVPGARDVLKELKALQELLGGMHDAHILMADASHAPGAGGDEEGHGARALHRTLAKERGEHFSAFRDRWLHGAAGAFLARVRALADELEGAPLEREVERKYLLGKFPSLKGLDAEMLLLDQGYLPGDRLAERVRRVRGPDGTRWYRTVKLGAGVSRIEVEEETTERIFRALWRLTSGRRVRKRRFRVRHGDVVWEIDRFRDRLLVLAEVELPGEDTPVEIPEWLGRVLVREVTGESEYVNLNLAR